jgi:hypothetical protein
MSASRCGCLRRHSSRRKLRHFLYIGGLELADDGQSSKPVMAAMAVAIRSRIMYWTAVSQSGQRTAWGWLFQPPWQEGNPTRGPDRGMPQGSGAFRDYPVCLVCE